MFLVINKRSIIAVGIIILSMILTVSVLVGFNKAKEEEHIPAAAVPTANKTIVVDAGHGGYDAGASDNGVIEKELNLQIAMKLKEFLESSGSTVIVTRDSDEATYDPNRKDGTSTKQSDLNARKALVEQYEANAFVSIHMNKFTQSQFRGAQVFYASNSDDSKRLGESIQSSLKELINDGNTREPKSAGNDIFILKDAAVPSALVECGFLSNPDEAQLLKDEEYQEQIAWSVYMGIVKFFAQI